jgi:hypothetical protein
MITKPDDVLGLVPAFAEKVQLLLAALRARGYSPVVVDGWRSAAEAHANAASGAGIDKSMHTWGCAADIAERTTSWSDPKFFDALGLEAEKLGLVWGGRWKRGLRGPDRPHVQGVSVALQARVRALRPDDVASVDAIVAGFLRGR